MNKTLISLLITQLITLPLLSSMAMASDDNHEESHGDSHEQGHKDEHTQKGPHGGFLLTNNALDLELKLTQFAGNTELRIYGFNNGKAVDINQLDVTVNVQRLSEEPQLIRFKAEDDYLVSTVSVNEPHSFKLDVMARYKGAEINYHYEQEEGRTTLSEKAVERAGIKTDIAKAGSVELTDTLFGVIAPTAQSTVEVMAPYTGLVNDIFVSIGQNVKKGEKLASITNRETLQNYTIKSPITGVITEQYLKRGELASSALMQIVNLETVWVELSAFPDNIEKLAIGQSATVYDLHHHLNAQGEVFYIAPMMSGGHIARARIELKNPDGHWRPGMHVNSDISTAKVDAALRVKAIAIQEFNGKPSVFIKSGNVFEVRPVKLGAKNSQWVEVLEGLSPNSEYVTENSYVIKADILKSGASHSH